MIVYWLLDGGTNIELDAFDIMRFYRDRSLSIFMFIEDHKGFIIAAMNIDFNYLSDLLEVFHEINLTDLPWSMLELKSRPSDNDLLVWNLVLLSRMWEGPSSMVFGH